MKLTKLGTVLYYDVKFQDGFKKLVRSENVKRLVDDENDVSAGPIDDKKEAEARRAEAELLLAIQKPHVKDELTVDANNKPCENPEGNQRKSTRVKKLKTFKDEIVYYPPSSTKTYNIIIPEVESAEPTKVIKRKLSVNSIEADLTNVKVNVPVKKVKIQQTDHLKRAITRSTREKKTNPLIQGYLKSVKLARSKKIKSTKSDHIISKEKKRKKKKDLIKKLIESSQLQLKKQQELIELQLKQHRHEKTKRKMLKLLKKQRLMEEQRNFTMENLNNIHKMNSNCSNNGQESSFLPIRCNFSNCDKTFRKQSLLEYHLKYHHYVDAKTFNNYDLEQIILSTPSVQLETTLASKSKSVSKKVDKDETFNKIEEDPDWQDIYSNDKNEDPYDIVHCSCGNHSSIGFMIQCEICLCWQHGDCLKLKSKDEVPDRHLCWLCTDPTNKLRELKYKSWLLVKNEKSSREILDSDSKTELKVEDMEKVNLLNICSKKYFNLNLLMHTIEYQHSLMNTINKQRDVEEIGANNRTMLNDKLEKLMLNILHLQDCATMKFEQFNKKLDGKISTQQFTTQQQQIYFELLFFFRI